MADQRLLFSELYDLADTAAYRYGVYGDEQTGEKAIKTSGASTTVSENASTDDVFQSTGLGDLISVKLSGPDGGVTTRLVTAVGSIPNSVTVNASVTIPADTCWRYRKWNNGTAATSGWFRVAGLKEKSVHFEWITKNADSADISIEGRINGGLAAVIWTENFTAVTKKIYGIPEYYDDIRVGIKITNDTGANNFKATFGGQDAYGA